MLTVNDIYNFLNSKFSYSLKESWDNTGIICGRLSGKVTKILFTLDITFDVIEECQKLGCNLIISHHPIVFSPINSITDDGYSEKKLLLMIEKGISAISCHTNLDVCSGGINDALAEILELRPIIPILKNENGAFTARMGRTDISDLKEFSLFVKSKLSCKSVRFADAKVPVKNVAVLGGSGGSYYEEIMKAGADTLVTGDAKYSNFLPCFENGLNLIDAGHYNTERIILPILMDMISRNFDLPVFKSKANSDIINFI